MFTSLIRAFHKSRFSIPMVTRSIALDRRARKPASSTGLKDCGSKQDVYSWRIPETSVYRNFELTGRPQVHASEDLLSRSLRFAGFVGGFVLGAHQSVLLQLVA